MNNGVPNEKRPNPAKERLSDYLPILQRRDEVLEAIEKFFGQATSCTARPKPVTVSGHSASYDRIAEHVVEYVDACAELEQLERELSEKLSETLALIDFAKTEQQKTVLTKRYINGKSWNKIANEIHCEKRHAQRIHGDALVEINKKM